MAKTKNPPVIDSKVIISTFLEIVREEETSESVSFREIARRIGCNHTNLYNYFDGFDDLRNCCLKHLIQSLRKSLLQQDSSHSAEAALHLFVFNLVDWAVKNSGYYRFLWVDRVEADAVESVFSSLSRPEGVITPILERLSDRPLQPENAQKIASILHSFVHGEIVKAVCLRSPSPKTLAQIVADEALFLAKALL